MPQVLTTSLISVSKEVADLTIVVHDALTDNHVSTFEKMIRRDITRAR